MLDAKQLRKLRRSDLFELLVEQAKEIEELQNQVKELEGKLESRELEVTDAGSIAEAALELVKFLKKLRLRQTCIFITSNVWRMQKRILGMRPKGLSFLNETTI